MEPKLSPPLAHEHLKDILSNEEFVDILTTFPKERGIISSYSYQYQGFWHNPVHLHGIINFQKHYEPRENDIFLATAPKSGTTWLRAILYALINRKTYPPNDPNHPLLSKNSHSLIPPFELLKPSEYDSVCNSSDPSTRIFGTHCAFGSLPESITDIAKSSNRKIIYLCRDIKDTFISNFHFANKANLRPSPISLEDAFDLYCKGISAGGPIWNHILGYWKESLEKPDKVLFMRYEEMKSEPHFQLRRLAHFLGKPFSQEEENLCLVDQIISLCSFDVMSKLEVNKTGKGKQLISTGALFRKGVVGDWKNILTADMASRLDQITEEKFRGSGLSL
ncbi:hypothetical protein DCAR_0935272 [Daucus carota subsp. sativus]|uniref:Sulfotransferase n=1 Tax=Daucus carota subsp. sativus TaxID=79200 RepID=A0A175YGQ5_DAUCS|nr:PREDICTED: cytosolic sulfotransferase 5-like [Daucus carota subsp. sativus]WOH15729.1 hypothetical protein DCAR_0935272 [Daucus carota subsp. sativus]